MPDSTYLIGSIGGSFMEFLVAEVRLVDHAKRIDIANGADPLLIAGPHRFDARADLQSIEIVAHDVRQRGVGAVEFDQDEGERDVAGMEMIDRFEDARDGGHAAGGSDFDPALARRGIELGVAEWWDDDAGFSGALTPDLFLFLEPGEEASNGLTGR